MLERAALNTVAQISDYQRAKLSIKGNNGGDEQKLDLYTKYCQKASTDKAVNIGDGGDTNISPISHHEIDSFPLKIKLVCTDKIRTWSASGIQVKNPKTYLRKLRQIQSPYYICLYQELFGHFPDES